MNGSHLGLLTQTLPGTSIWTNEEEEATTQTGPMALPVSQHPAPDDITRGGHFLLFAVRVCVRALTQWQEVAAAPLFTGRKWLCFLERDSSVRPPGSAHLLPNSLLCGGTMGAILTDRSHFSC